MKPHLHRIASALGAVLSTVVLTAVASAPAASGVVLLPGVTA